MSNISAELGQTNCKVCGLPAASLQPPLCSHCEDPDEVAREKREKWFRDHPAPADGGEIKRRNEQLRKENSFHFLEVSQGTWTGMAVTGAVVFIVTWLILQYGGMIL